MSDTVTIDRTHFEALLRRAEFHSAEPQIYDTFQLQKVLVSQVVYNGLRRAEYEYKALRAALLDGGIDPQTLDTLIHGGSEKARKDSGYAQEGDAMKPESTIALPQYPDDTSPIHDTSNEERPFSVSQKSSAEGTFKYVGRQASQDHLQVPKSAFTWQQKQDFGRPHSPMSPSDTGVDTAGADYDHDAGMPFPRHGKRTLLITGFSEQTTFKDLTSVIRGGRILYMTTRKARTAIVFMLEGAVEFHNYVKRHDLYVQNKRVEVHWNDHQFALTPHVGRKVAAGATRNIVLRNAAHVVNTAEIRHHMEHIHKFEIISIVTRGKDVYIYTNAVHNALFARSCMMSRKPYKGMRIEFFPDECAAPLPVTPRYSATKTSPPPAKELPSGNMYEMLSVDSDEENDPYAREDDDDSTIDGGTSDHGVSLGA